MRLTHACNLAWRQTIEANRIGADPSRRLLRRQRGPPYGAGVAATFPAFDPAGNVTYVQARYLNPDETGRKYDNPSGAIAPHPRLAFPVTTARAPADTLVVCEGLPDALTAAQAGSTAQPRSPDLRAAVDAIHLARRTPRNHQSTAGYRAGVLTGAAALIPAAFIVSTKDRAVSSTIADTARCAIATCTDSYS